MDEHAQVVLFVSAAMGRGPSDPLVRGMLDKLAKPLMLDVVRSQAKSKRKRGPDVLLSNPAAKPGRKSRGTLDVGSWESFGPLRACWSAYSADFWKKLDISFGKSTLTQPQIVTATAAASNLDLHGAPVTGNSPEVVDSATTFS